MKMTHDKNNNSKNRSKQYQDVKKHQESPIRIVPGQCLPRLPKPSPSTRVGRALVSSRLRVDSRKMRKRKVAAFKKVVDGNDSSSSEDEDDEHTGVDHLSEGDNEFLQSSIKSNNSKNRRRLSQLVEPMSSKLILHRELRRLEYMTSFFASGTPGMNRFFRLSTASIWLVSLTLYFAFDINEAVNLYGYTFLAAQGMWMLNFVLCTWATCYRVLPWLKEGLRQLRRDECCEYTITKVLQMVQKVPYIALLFGLVASGCQHVFLYIDEAFHLGYFFHVNDSGKTALHFVRYIAGAHVYAGYVVFWLIPTTVMLMTGYSMAEFLDQFDAKIRDKQHVMSFKEAISSYSTRAKFVKEASSKCGVALAVQLTSVIICFGLNTYVFLFSPIRRYLHVWHSIVPLLVMMYPLCCAAWVTKQYTWFIIVVVKAWVHRDDLDDDSDSSDGGDSGVDEISSSQGRFSKLFQGQFFKKKVVGSASASTSFQQLSRPHSSKLYNTNDKSAVPSLSTGNLKDKLKNAKSLLPWQQKAGATTNNNNKPNSAFGKLIDTMAAAKAVSKFKRVAKRPRFNFEKFLSYLESMRAVVGFHIAGVMITWDKVSTTLFLLFSIIAVFVQESIFGSKKSTL